MSNRLAGETSPYLLQHADNPVDWYPWGDDALALARREARPILLSIGYSACHWCHVMAHESFEDERVAAVMNAHFVNIKVDREERPDLDKIYQTALALLTRRSGGWPLTMFVTPSGAPFFGGTYFPKESRYGVAGFLDLLPRIAAAYREQGEAIAVQSARLADALSSLEPQGVDSASAPLPRNAPAIALEGLARTFDAVDGGFGGAPKFPHPTELAFCLRRSTRDADENALGIVTTTLARMADGGIHDQLGGGFCRYSVDAQWTIPHFEKMLYDNGPLLALYADTSQAANMPRFAEVARGIVGWMTREMRSPDGAFYSSLDADSEGEEGRFYVFSREEVRAALSDDEYAVAAPHWGLDGAPDFEGHAWHLRVVVPLDDVAQRLSIGLADAASRLVGAKAALFALREKRVRPGRDDKILTSWNALAIGGLARASRALDEPRWADLAFEAVDSLRRRAWRDARLLATRKDHRAHLNAYLDDYAFVLAALLELMQTRFRLTDYQWAREIADVLLAQFEDRELGGFFFTSHDHEALFHRTKPGHDEATPSGNGIAARALIALGHLAAEPRYVDAGERAVRLFASQIAQSPGGFSTLIEALEDSIEPPASVMITGDPDVAAQWQRALARRYRPWLRVFAVGEEPLPPELTKGAPPARGALAWVCRGTHCLPPVAQIDAVESALAERV